MPLPPELHSNWSTLSQLLDEALTLAPESRAAFVDSLSGERAQLRDTLRQLLEGADGVETSDFMATLPQFTQTVASGALADLARGDTIGPYRLLHELGTGGMGSVWLAERADGTLKRKVALKLPRLTWARGLAERMGRERDILASLEHPYIARLYDAGLDQLGRPYLALEYVEGQPIDVYARERGLSVRQRLDLLLQVCAAVAFAHSRLVVHRDLKPSNILVTADGQVRLLDFGIAKLIEGDTANETQLTQLAGRALTLDYASPEQIKGEPIGTASDVYSLGVVAYELLTGAKPYRLKRGSAAELEEAIATVDAPRASESAAELQTKKALKGDLDAILNKALKKQTTERYATVDALALDMRRHLTHEPVSAQADSLLYRANRFVARYRLAVIGTSASIAALAVALVVALAQAERAERERQTALEANRRAQLSQAAAEAQSLVAQLQRQDAEQARNREMEAASIARLEGERARQAAAEAQRSAQRAAAESKRAGLMAERARNQETKAVDLNSFTLNVLGRIAADPTSPALRQNMADAIGAELATAEAQAQANTASLAAIHGAMASVFNYLQRPDQQMQSALKELDYLQRSAAAPAELAESHRQLALAYARRGEFSNAVEQAELGLARLQEPLTDVNRVLRARLHRAQGRYRYLQGDIARAVVASGAAVAELDRVTSSARERAQNHFGSAIADHVTNLAMQARDDEAHQWLRRIDAFYLDRPGIRESDRADVELARGRLYLETGHPSLAADAFREAGRLYLPQFGAGGNNAATVDGLLIGALAVDGRFDESLALLAKWQQANVRPMLLDSVLVYMAREDLRLADQALKQLEGDARFLASSPARVLLAALHRGEWLIAAGRPREAIEFLTSAEADAARMLPGATRWQRQFAFALIVAMLELGDVNGAKVVLNRTCPTAAASLGSVEQRRCSDMTARVALATGHAMRAIDLLGSMAVDRPFREALDARIVLGRSFLALDRPADALAVFSEASQMTSAMAANSPLRATVHAWSGLALVRLGRPAEARRQLEQANAASDLGFGAGWSGDKIVSRLQAELSRM